MKKNIFILFTVMLSFTAATAQSDYKITGAVTSDNGKLPSVATIVLHKVKDSSIVKTELTNKEGKYEFSIKSSGAYFVSASVLGYTKNSSAPFTITDSKSTEVPVIDLKLAPKELAGITVRSQKPLIEIKADKMVINVENSINATGSNAMELLQKSPGVVVDKDDNISVKGKTGVRIYIDGRPSQMDSQDLAALLRSMNSADIESIEFITNPSAKYDASGNAGIINIKLKKDKRVGFNGNVSTGVMFGITPKNMNSISLNYRNKKANFFGNYSNGLGINQNDMNFQRQQADSLFDTRSINKRDLINNNFKVGADFFINTKSTIGFIATGSISDGEVKNESKTPISAISTGEVTRTLLAENNMPTNRKSINYNANYKFADTSGHELNVDVDYGTFKGRTSSYQPNVYVYADGSMVKSAYKNNTPIDIDIFSSKADYEQKLGKGKLGLGGKYSNVKTNNVFDFWNVIDGADVYNPGRSNKFTYIENVSALYANYNNTFKKKWTVQAGLRMEHTESEGDLTSSQQPKPEDNVKRSYTDFFPSAAISFAANQKNSFNVTYSRRIQRPSYQALNPFEEKIDELSYRKGNPFLKPQYNNSFEISHVYKYKLTTTLGYSHITDLITQVMDTTEKTKTYMTTRNLANQDIFSLNVGLPIQVTKWWNAFINGNTNYSLYEATFDDGKVIKQEIFNYNFYGQNSFTLKKGLTAELSGWFNGPGIWGGTFKTQSMGGFDIGLQKLVLKNKGTVKISLTDVAKTMRWNAYSNFGGVIFDGNGGWESHQFRMNFSYRFGKSTVKSERQRKTGTEDENKRLNGGGGLGNN